MEKSEPPEEDEELFNFIASKAARYALLLKHLTEDLTLETYASAKEKHLTTADEKEILHILDKVKQGLANQLYTRTLSLDRPLAGDEEDRIPRTLYDVIPAPSEETEDETIKPVVDPKKVYQEVDQYLSRSERLVLEARRKGLQLKEIAKQTGRTPRSIGSISTSVSKKIRVVTGLLYKSERHSKEYMRFRFYTESLGLTPRDVLRTTHLLYPPESKVQKVFDFYRRETGLSLFEFKQILRRSDSFLTTSFNSHQLLMQDLKNFGFDSQQMRHLLITRTRDLLYSKNRKAFLDLVSSSAHAFPANYTYQEIASRACVHPTQIKNLLTETRKYMANPATVKKNYREVAKALANHVTETGFTDLRQGRTIVTSGSAIRFVALNPAIAEFIIHLSTPRYLRRFGLLLHQKARKEFPNVSKVPLYYRFKDQVFRKPKGIGHEYDTMVSMTNYLLKHPGLSLQQVRDLFIQLRSSLLSLSSRERHDALKLAQEWIVDPSRTRHIPPQTAAKRVQAFAYALSDTSNASLAEKISARYAAKSKETHLPRIVRRQAAEPRRE